MYVLTLPQAFATAPRSTRIAIAIAVAVISGLDAVERLLRRRKATSFFEAPPEPRPSELDETRCSCREGPEDAPGDPDPSCSECDGTGFRPWGL